jgi:hypothetical protein
MITDSIAGCHGLFPVLRDDRQILGAPLTTTRQVVEVHGSLWRRGAFRALIEVTANIRHELAKRATLNL